MKLFEYMAKEIFAKYEIPVPKGKVCYSPEEVSTYFSEIGPCVIKAQVLAGGRGKAGGVKFASNIGEAEVNAREILGMDLKGNRVERLLVEEKLAIQKEIYLAITVDNACKKPVLIVSACGGMDIEEVPEEQIIKHHFDLQEGIGQDVLERLNYILGFEGPLTMALQDTISKVYRIFREYEAELVEINPLVVVEDRILAADGKMNIDDEALFRSTQGFTPTEERTQLEKKAHDLGISFVELEGDIAVMANGAGITMATLDLIQQFGGSPRNFMDAGGGASKDAMAAALELLLSTRPKAILINIFGGITRCDDVAQAILDVQERIKIEVPFVIRLVGTNEEAGVDLLRSKNIKCYSAIREAIEEVIKLAKAS